MVADIDLNSIKPMANGKKADIEMKTHFDPLRRKLLILSDAQ